MRYLFFDIECCDGVHMCEFGYVITDTDFNILDRDCFTINPEAPFNLTGRKHSRDLILYFDEETYYKSPKFPRFYRYIKKLLEQDDQIVIGYATNNDAKFLDTACDRNKFAQINFKYYDVQAQYGKLFNNGTRTSIEKAAEALLEHNNCILHKSDEDALLTMLIFKAMCVNQCVTVDEMLQLCADSISDSESCRKSRTAGMSVNRYKKKSQRVALLQFLDGVTAEGDIVPHWLNGKKVSMSINYENRHHNQTLSIIQLLINVGATYIFKATTADVFIRCDTDVDCADMHCSRHEYVNNAIADGANITILTIDELLDQLGITHQQLQDMPYPTEDKFVARARIEEAV